MGSGLKLDKHRISDLDKTEFDNLKWSKILPTKGLIQVPQYSNGGYTILHDYNMVSFLNEYFHLPNEDKTLCKLFT